MFTIYLNIAQLYFIKENEEILTSFLQILDINIRKDPELREHLKIYKIEDIDQKLTDFIEKNTKIQNLIKNAKLNESNSNIIFFNNEINGVINNGNVETQTINYNSNKCNGDKYEKK